MFNDSVMPIRKLPEQQKYLSSDKKKRRSKNIQLKIVETLFCRCERKCPYGLLEGQMKQ
jgi:hypothetical protein